MEPSGSGFKAQDCLYLAKSRLGRPKLYATAPAAASSFGPKTLTPKIDTDTQNEAQTRAKPKSLAARLQSPASQGKNRPLPHLSFIHIPKAEEDRD